MASASRQRRIVAAVPGVALLLCGVGVLSVDRLGADGPARPGVLQLVPGASPGSEGPSDGSSEGSSEEQGREDVAPFAATGPVTAVRPGQVRTVEVKVTNPDQVPYRILRLTATPEGADRGCPGGTDVVVSGYDSAKAGATSYVVPRRSSITIPLTLMMIGTGASADSCRDRDVPLTFAGLVTR